jgi:hypothetical protein
LKNRDEEQQELEFQQVCRYFWERERAGEEEISERPGGPLTIGGRGQGWAAPPGGEVAWQVPLRSPRCLSAPFFT